MAATRAPTWRDVPWRATRRAAWALPGLLALSAVYRLLTALRALAYRQGWRAPQRVDCPVLSVGNLAVGGSGKTPLVDWLLRAARQAGRRPVAIARGHGRRSGSDVSRVCLAEGARADPLALGDEPALLAARNPDVPVYVSRTRSAAARLALAWDRPGLIVLDDGFQHRGLARELDVVLVDAQQGLGNGALLPLGPLREPLAAARRAHAVLIAKANLGDAEALRARIGAALGAAVPVFTAEYRPARLRRLDGAEQRPPASLRGATVRLLCAIAQPAGFVRTVEALGARVAEVVARPDHHPYPDAELAGLAALLGATEGAAHLDANGAALWLTTEKDAVKLAGRLPAPERLWVLEMEVLPDAAAQAFFFDFIAHGGLQ